jgi:hypothetical protein
MSRTRTLTCTGVVLTALALAVPPLSPAAAAQRPDRIALETGSLPEGIAAGPGSTFFVGARSDGDIFIADVRDSAVTRIVDETTTGAAAVGMYYDDRSGLLWVAGGGPASRGLGTVTAYRGSEEVFQTTVEGARFLNDVVATRDAVYVTDSGNAALVVLPLRRNGRPTGDVEPLALTGDYVQPSGFGANGIRALPNGDLVVVSGGVLYLVDPSTGAADRIEVSGRRLTGGDGLELRGRTLYVVNGYGGDEVVVLRLARDGRSATTTGVIPETSPDQLDRPTTAALVAGSLYVVNGRFSVAGPTTENFVTRLPRR